MKKAMGVVAVSLFTAGIAGRVYETAPPVPALPPATESVPTPRAVPVKLFLQWETPGSLSPILFSSSGSNNPSFYDSTVGNWQLPEKSKPLSSVRLFENKTIIAEMSNDGRLRYQFNGPHPLGAGVGGNFSTNAVKLTLSWSSKR